MGLFFLPKTLRARLALAGMLTLMYIIGSTVYIRYPSMARPGSMAEVQVPLPLEEETPTPGKRPLSQPEADIPAVPPAADESSTSQNTPILLVSAIFPLQKTKFSKDKYEAWFKTYLSTITTDIYLYTTPELAPQFQSLRKPGSRLTLDTTYATPFDIPPLVGKEEMYVRIQKKDREHGGRRTSNMTDTYALRNAKAFFLDRAVKVTREGQGGQKRQYEYIFWNDPGSFRNEEHQYRQWPDLAKVKEAFDEGAALQGEVGQEELMFVPTFDPPHESMSFWTESLGPVDSKFSEGSFFGGTPTAISWFSRTFYAYHDHFLSLELFIGKDTVITNALVLLFPSHFITVWHNDPSSPAHLELSRPPATPEEISSTNSYFLGQCGSIWHYYQFFLADEQTQEGMRDLWMKKATGWRWWGWWNSVDKTRCRQTRVLSMLDVLRSRFGDGWRAPGSGVSVPAVGWN